MTSCHEFLVSLPHELDIPGRSSCAFPSFRGIQDRGRTANWEEIEEAQLEQRNQELIKEEAELYLGLWWCVSGLPRIDNFLHWQQHES